MTGCFICQESIEKSTAQIVITTLCAIFTQQCNLETKVICKNSHCSSLSRNSCVIWFIWHEGEETMAIVSQSSPVKFIYIALHHKYGSKCFTHHIIHLHHITIYHTTYTSYTLYIYTRTHQTTPAHSQVNEQFIFLTPPDMHVFGLREEIRVPGFLTQAKHM